MASKKSAKVKQTNPTFVVGRVYLVTNGVGVSGVKPQRVVYRHEAWSATGPVQGVVCDDTCAARETRAYSRYVGPSALYGHILEDGDGDVRYAKTEEIEAV